MKDTRKKAILVDDMTFYLLSTKERLKKHYEVFPAGSSADLFELLKNVIPDIILLDINMPDCDGYETIKKLKEDAEYSDIPVVFLTANDDKQSVIKGINLGAADYVKKPFTDTELIECIEYQLNPGKLADGNKPIVLAVDDCPSILKSVNYLLNDRYKVYTLNESEKLNALLGIIKPDLFLLDCKMPVLSGFDLVPIIRRHVDHEETPIVYLTSEGTIDNISVAIHLGACDFIVKPIDDAVLREKMALHLKDFRIRRRIRSIKGK
jgi:DNA-binding response OmpR family regulator